MAENNEAENIKKTIGEILSSSSGSSEVINDIIKEAISRQAIVSSDISNKLIEAASGSKEIYNPINEVSGIKEV